MNEEPIQSFIFTKEHSPRDSQDERIIPEHFEIIQNIRISIMK